MRPSGGRGSKRRGRAEREEYGEPARARGSRLPAIILTVVLLGVIAGLGALAWTNRDILGDIFASFQGGSGSSPTPVSAETGSASPAGPESGVRDVGEGAGISAPAGEQIARVEPGDVPALPGARQKAILQSMTPFERMNPEEIHAQRRQRIARGSGTGLNDVNELLKSFKQMRRQMKEIKGTLMGRMGARQMEKRKAKILKEMKKGRIPGLPGM